MRFLILFLAFFSIKSPFLIGQEVQWASSLLGFSSEYSTKEYSANQVLGKPNSITYGKSMTSWAQASDEAGKEFVKVGFATPMQVQQIVVMENLNPGSIAEIILYDETGKEYTVFKNGKPVSTGVPEARLFTHLIAKTYYKVSALKLVIQSDAVRGMNQIDAIGISTSTNPIKPGINLKQYTQAVPPPQNLGPLVNSEYDDMLPIVSPDNTTLYFARKNAPENFGNTGADDIYVSKRDPITGQWQKSKNIGQPLNDADHNFVCAVSVDGQRLYLANSYRANGGGDGVSISYQKNGVWSKPQFLNIKNMYNKSKFACYHLSIDEKTIVMAIERDDTKGDMDLYVSKKYADDTWSEPLNMGPVLNTAAAEGSIFLAADSKTIYFASAGHAGYGDFDMFMSKRLDETWQKWSEPVNLGPEINTIYRDFYYTIPGNGEYAYFATDYNSYGRSDLFRLALPKELQPEKTSGLMPGNAYLKYNEPTINNPSSQAPVIQTPSNIQSYDDKLEQLKAQLEKANMQKSATTNAIENKNQQINNPSPIVQNNPILAPSSPIINTPSTSKPKDAYTLELEAKLAKLKGERENLNNTNTNPTNNNWNAPIQQNNAPIINNQAPYLKPNEQIQDNKNYNDKLAELKAQRDNVKEAPKAPKAKDIVVDNSKPDIKYTPPTNTTPTAPTPKAPEVISYEEKLAKLKGEKYTPAPAPTQQPNLSNTQSIISTPNTPTENPVFVDYPNNGKDFVFNPNAPEPKNAGNETIPQQTQNTIPVANETQINNLDAEAEKLKQQIIFAQDLETKKALQDQLNKLENEKTALQNEKNQLELNNQQLQNNSNDLKTQNKTLAEQKKQLDDQILAMENEKKRIEQDKWELEQEKKMLEFQKNKQQKDIEQLQKEIADLNNKKIEANKYSNKTAEEIEFNLPLKVGATTNVKNIFFAANSFVMKPTSDPQMEKIVSFLKQNNTIKIEIGGHTNGLCDEDYCKMLSEKRAKSVVDYLIMRGISANRLTYAGYGKTKPIVVDVNNMPTASELNQRVEVKITSLE